MARKMGLNVKEQILCAKWLKEGVDPKQIAKKFKTTAAIVKRFTQEKLDAFKEKSQGRAAELAEKQIEDGKKADVVKKVLDNMQDDDFK